MKKGFEKKETMNCWSNINTNDMQIYPINVVRK